MSDKLNELLGFQESVLRIRSQRQGVLASNIANADTPNYRARDFDFKAALQLALNAQKANENRLSLTDERHQPEAHPEWATKEMVAGVPLLYRTLTQGSVDNNTVDMDVERNQFADNALRYEASVSIISNQIKNLIAVIQG
ncbi:MAG: flagellar basal body rod protein FlgB [Burkholderiaceae bacterium]|nr:flagellar basal body rod protein FlgB [Burkholderiaceae bacterium]